MNCRMTLLSMRGIIVAVLLVSLCPQSLAGEGVHSCTPQQWRKVTTIFRLQDLRRASGDSLMTFLRDPDPVVRARAAIALASVQDTAALSALQSALSDSVAEVAVAAAFAIGQTAGAADSLRRSSIAGEMLAHVTGHVPEGKREEISSGGRMLEEMGKFASAEWLGKMVSDNDLTSSEPLKQGLIRGIARCAIRGVRNPRATALLLQLAARDSSASWETFYALQRIGSTPETRHAVRLLLENLEHIDPLIRMNIAVLLGKIGDSTDVEDALIRHAEGDPDWRVRVNAYRALGSIAGKGNMRVAAAFRAGFDDHQPLVAIAAVSAYGSSSEMRDDSISGSLKRILTARLDHAPPQLKGEAALALARKQGQRAIPSLLPETQSDASVVAQCIRALGLTGSDVCEPILFRSTRDSDPRICCAALDGLNELCRANRQSRRLIDSTYRILLAAITSSDVAVRTTAATMLGDSLFLRPSSVGPLLAALDLIRLPDDIEAFQAIANTLGILHDTSAVAPLRKYLRGCERSVTEVSAEALRRIDPASGPIQEDPLSAPRYTDFDFGFLRSLDDTVHITITTTRGSIEAELYPWLAPFTVMSVLKLAEKRFYDGLLVHRVVPNFVLQGGDPRGDGWGGPGYAIRSEFSPLFFEAGSLGIASAGKDTEGSQFFITHSPQPHLDGRYTMFGKVVRGMGVADSVMIGDRIVRLEVRR